MRRLNYCALVALVLMLLVGSRAMAANLLVNPGFEDPITQDGPPFVGFWEGFSGGAGASASNSTTTPRSGAQSLQLQIVNTDNTFAGAFQDVDGLTPGTPVTFSGWHRSDSVPLDLTSEFRIEWRNASAEVARTNGTLTPATAQYTQFVLNDVVPAGASIARVVYAIQTFTGGPTNNGTVYLDDMSFETVPEPATAGLLGLVGVGLVGLRRRRA